MNKEGQPTTNVRQVHLAIKKIRNMYDELERDAFRKMKEAKAIHDDEIKQFTEDFLNGTIKLGAILKLNREATQKMHYYSKLQTEIIDCKQLHIQEIVKIFNSKSEDASKSRDISYQLDRAIKQTNSFVRKISKI